MYQYLKRLKIKNGVHIVLLILNAAVTVGTAITLALMTNQLAKQNFQGFLFWIGIEIGLFLLTLLLSYIVSVNQTKLIQEMMLMMREDYIAKLTKHTYREFQEKALGEHISVLNNDLKIVEESGFDSFYQMITTIFTTLFSIVALISYDYRIVLLTIVLTVVLTYLPRPFSKRMETLMEQFSKGNASFVEGISDQLSGYSALYYAGEKQRLQTLIRMINQRFNKEKLTFTKKSTGIQIVMALFSIVGQVSVLLVTGLLISVGQLSIGTIASVGQISGNIFNSLSSLNSLHIALQSVKPIFDKFNDNDLILEGKKVQEFEMLQGENAGYSFGEKNIFQQLNFQFKKGKKYAIVGESGSGKSTFIQILLGNYKDYEGKIAYNCQTLAHIDENSLIQQVAYISNHTHIYQDTLRNNLTLWNESFDEASLLEVLEKVNLNSLVSRLDEHIAPDKLSEGQKQRIGIARAYLRNRNFIIMDEATSNIDHKNAKFIEDALLSDSSKTYLTITHHLRPEEKDKFDEIITFSI